MNKKTFEKLKNWDYSGLSDIEKTKSFKKKLEVYNADPFICEYCKEPIEITDSEQLKDKMRSYETSGRVFCNRSHSASYNNLHNSKERYEKRTLSLWKNYEDEFNLTDKQIKDAFKKATSICGFYKLLNMNKRELTTQMLARFEKLNLDVSDIKFSKRNNKEKE